MMQNLEAWAGDRRPRDLGERARLWAASVSACTAPLAAMERPIDIRAFMGRWFVIANIPTRFDRDTVNNTEDYEWDEGRKVVNVKFSYSNRALTKNSVLEQQASLQNEA